MRISWIDVETTGTEARKDDLLQVACIVTDGDLNILDEKGYTAEIYYSEEDVAILQNHTSPYVLNMHSATSLWDKLPLGKPLETVDVELQSYLANFSEEGKSYLGGNSITLDRNFINEYLPKSGAYLSYRSVDVSSFAIVAEEWYNGLYFEKSYLHDAMSDIKESIEQLKFFRKKIFK